MSRALTVHLTLVFALSVCLAAADDPIAAEATAVEQAPSSRWIGVMCHPPTDALRAQLSLPAGQGLVVGQVVAKSPAAKAGIQKNDLLLQADQQPLSSPSDLSRIVNASDEQAIAIELMRTGRRRTIDVTPSSRPLPQPEAVALPGPEQQALRDLIQGLVEKGGQPPNANRRFRLRFLHPGMILGEGDLADNFPKDVSITINREGEDPLKITVEKDGEKWEIDRNGLEQLPESLMPLVERLLGSHGLPLLPDGDIDLDLPNINLPKIDVPGVAAPDAGIANPPPAPAAAQPAAEKAGPSGDDLDELQQQLKQLERQLKELQKQSTSRAKKDDT